MTDTWARERAEDLARRGFVLNALEAIGVIEAALVEAIERTRAEERANATKALKLAEAMQDKAVAAERERILARLNNPDEEIFKALSNAEPYFLGSHKQAIGRAIMRSVCHALAAVLSSPKEEHLTDIQRSIRDGTFGVRSATDEERSAIPPSWQPTHRHRKGGEYRVVRRGRLEWNLEPAVIYESKDGTTWIRPEAEFEDGRFTLLSSPPQEKG